MFKGIALYETSRKSCLSFVLKYAIHKMVMNIEKKNGKLFNTKFTSNSDTGNAKKAVCG